MLYLLNTAYDKAVGPQGLENGDIFLKKAEGFRAKLCHWSISSDHHGTLGI